MHHPAVLDLPMLTVESAGPESAQLLEGARAKLGFVPNMYGYMGHSPELLKAYLSGYADFRSGAGFTPPEQETVFLTISLANGCDYCAAAHSMLAEKVSKLPADSLAALRAGKPLPDAKLDALATFTRVIVEKQGLPSQADADAFLKAGYTPRHVLGVVLALSVKILSNYVNHMVDTPIDAVFAGHALDA